MILRIVAEALRFRLVVVALAAAVMAIGITQLRQASVDVLPEFTPAYVEIQTEALGLSADEVEQLVTVPLEADLLNGVEGVDVIRSQSVPGLSSIVLVFEPGTDVYRGRQLVQERLTQIGAAAFPNVSKPPTLLQPLSSSSRVLMVGLSSEDLRPIEESVIARWTVRPRLLGVPGVANVAIWGMRDQQLQVQVDPERLRDRNVTLDQVVETTGNAQVFSPLSFLEASTPGTGGFIETPHQRLQVRNVLEKIADPEELGKVPIEGTGGSLRLTDVADIRVDHQPLIGDAVVNDGVGLVLVVEKFPGANTLEVTRGVEDALEKLRPGLSGVRTDTSVFRPASFIEDALDNVALALVIASVLLALVLVAFLFDGRSLLVALVTIPLSLVAAALVLDLLGETFNAMSFAGLAAALALVVDDAVVGAENIARHLRRNGETAGDRSTAAVVLEATHEVRSPLAYATLIALVAIVPIAVMEGRPGAFFQPLVLSYAVTVAVAMAVALTVTPVLSLLLFSRGTTARRESPLLGWIRPRYDAALSRFARAPWAALIAAGACVVLGLVVLPLLGTSLVPSFKDRGVLVHLEAEPGTSNSRMTEIATEVSRELRSLPGVENVGAHVGRAVTGDQIVDVNSSEVWVSVESDAEYDATLASIKDVVRRVPGVERDVVTYSTQRIRDVGALEEGENPVRGNQLDVLTGSERPLVVRVYGQDLGVLRREANKVRQIMSEVDGVVDPRVDLPATQPTLEIEVDLDKARRHGIKPGDVRRAEATLLQGIQVGSVFKEQKVFDVVVQGVPELRTGLASVRNLLIDQPGGGHVRLGDVADVRAGRSPTIIERDAVSRRLDVEANVSGRSLGTVAGELEDRLADISFPLEYHAEVLQETAAAEMGATRILAFAIAAVLAVFLLLQAAFQSWRLALLASLTLPVALVGGLLAALVSGAELSLGPLVGLLALLGIAVRNAVLAIRDFQPLERDEGEPFAARLVGRATGGRLVPTLASAFAVAVVALPFVALGSRPGLEIVHPMAVVVLGGLVTSTFLALFVLPALYLRFAAAQPVPRSEGELIPYSIDGEPEPVVAEAGPVAGRDTALAARGGSAPPRPGDAGEPLPSHYRQVESEETPEGDVAPDREGEARGSQIIDPKRGENEPGARKPPV
ncbi:MAG: efflux RND transporter permease subunit [Actinomycetota bacterium]|nr:efflux RND transporter permease subunit [Actinomycetota bacterium]